LAPGKLKKAGQKSLGRDPMIAATRRTIAIGAALLALAVSPARAQSDATYPNKVIRIVVGFAAGGGNDIVARVIADKLAQRLGQPVIVDNKPGSVGFTSAAFVAGQPADGHTLLLGASGAMAIAPLVTAAMPFDTLRDFSPISLVAGFPLVMIVSGKSEFKTVQDLVAWSKGNQEKANYATSSPTFTSIADRWQYIVSTPAP